MNVKNLIYHGVFVLALSSLLTMGIIYAQGVTTATFPLGPMPKLIVFIVSIVISIITDGIMMLTISGGFHAVKVLISSIPWAFVNIYWWDFIAPASGSTLFTLRFMPIGDPSWNYWIGINIIAAFVCNFLFSQIIFRALRGAATSPNWQDALLAGIDAVIPAILFIVLPMLGLF